MKKRIFAALGLAALLLTGWASRQAFNRPKSVVVNSATNSIPTAFSNAAGSLVMQNITGNFYQNMMVINETHSPISVLTLPEVSSAPAASVTGQRIHVMSYGAAVLDNVSIFDNLYIQSEDNVINSGKVKVTIW